MQHSATIKANTETLEELATLLADRPGSVVPFVGAGTSIAYGMPGWKNFLDYLGKFVVRESAMTPRQESSLRRALKKGHLEDAAQLLYDALGEPKFRTALQSRFRLNNQSVSTPLRRIVELSNGLILTTNYDRVVEGAWQASFEQLGVRREVAQLLSTSKDDLGRALTGGGHAVLKLHGDVDRPESWVLTKDHYAAMYADPAFRRFLSRFFSAHVPLFIGCSMTEERLLDAMREDGCVGYAILATPTLPARSRCTRTTSSSPGRRRSPVRCSPATS